MQAIWKNLKSYGALIVFFVICANPARAEIRVVDQVDVNSYVGLWYEFARIPNSFEDRDGRVCINVTAEYQVIGKNRLSVVNTCRYYNESGEYVVHPARGRAVIDNPGSNSKLKVDFIPVPILRDIIRWFSQPNYLIAGLGPKNTEGLYTWAIIASPDREYGWVLTRERNLNPEERIAIQSILLEQGYNPNDFIETLEP